MVRRLRRVNRPGEARREGRLEGPGRGAVKDLEGNASPRSIGVIAKGRGKAARRAVGVEQALSRKGGRQAYLLEQPIPEAKGRLSQSARGYGGRLRTPGPSLREKAQQPGKLLNKKAGPKAYRTLGAQ